MEKLNKTLISELEEYFLTQDPKIIARTLGCMMIDLHRVNFFSDLPPNEAENLKMRLEHNSNELIKFSKFGPQGEFKCTNIESKDE